MNEQKIIMLTTSPYDGSRREEAISCEEAIDQIYYLCNSTAYSGHATCKISIYEDDECVWWFRKSSGLQEIKRYRQQDCDYRHTGVLDVIESFHKALEEAKNG